MTNRIIDISVYSMCRVLHFFETSTLVCCCRVACRGHATLVLSKTHDGCQVTRVLIVFTGNALFLTYSPSLQ